jgi:hypothetical protein
MATSSPHPSTAEIEPPSTNSIRTVTQTLLALFVLLLGAGLVGAGIAGIFMIRVNGIGRLLGCGIVLGLGLLVHGWALLTTKYRAAS